MNRPSAPVRTRRPYFWPVVIVAVALTLVIGILLLKAGSDDPLVKESTPPVTAAQPDVTETGQPTIIDEHRGEIPATEGAIDGKGVTATGPEQPPATGDTEHHDDHSHGDATPKNEAAAAGPYVATAVKFAWLSVNRSTDEAASVGLNKKLVEFAAGSLAVDLENSRGGVATAQVPSRGEVIKAIPLSKGRGYAEVLIITKESVIDASTGITLDPKYLTYLVRLDRVRDGHFAVTSWEPQL